MYIYIYKYIYIYTSVQKSKICLPTFSATKNVPTKHCEFAKKVPTKTKNVPTKTKNVPAKHRKSRHFVKCAY